MNSMVKLIELCNSMVILELQHLALENSQMILQNTKMISVVAYHVATVASEHGLLIRHIDLLQGVLIRHSAAPLISLELLNYCLTLAMSSGRCLQKKSLP